MARAEPGYGGVVGGSLSLEQVHEVDVPLAGGLDLPGTEDPVHVRVYQNGQHLPGRRLSFLDARIGAVQLRQVHPSNEMAKQADGVVLWYLKLKIQREDQLI